MLYPIVLHRKLSTTFSCYHYCWHYVLTVLCTILWVFRDSNLTATQNKPVWPCTGFILFINSGHVQPCIHAMLIYDLICNIVLIKLMLNIHVIYLPTTNISHENQLKINNYDRLKLFGYNLVKLWRHWKQNIHNIQNPRFSPEIFWMHKDIQQI